MIAARLHFRAFLIILSIPIHISVRWRGYMKKNAAKFSPPRAPGNRQGKKRDLMANSKHHPKPRIPEPEKPPRMPPVIADMGPANNTESARFTCYFWVVFISGSDRFLSPFPFALAGSGFPFPFSFSHTILDFQLTFDPLGKKQVFF